MSTKSLRHKFVSAVADTPNPSLIRPSSWNDDHDFLLGFNSQTGLTYTIADADHLSFISFSNAAPVAVTLPQAGSSGGTLFKSGWTVFFRNSGAGVVTITPTTSTINGGGAIPFSLGQGGILFSDGTNYQLLPFRLSLASDIIDATTIGRSILQAANAAAVRTLTGAQAQDADLDTIAGLTATTDNFIQSKSSAWASRTPAQVAVDLFSATAFGPIGRIPFPAVQVASVGANDLDEYEEGLWTPTIVGSTIAGTFTYNIREGYYVKIGQLVYVSFTVLLSAMSVAPTGTFVTITGLPFTGNAAFRQGNQAADWSGFANTKVRLGVQLQANATSAFVTYNPAAAALEGTLPASEITATTHISASFCYRASA